MSTKLFTMIAALSLFGVPALAQSGGSSSGGPTGNGPTTCLDGTAMSGSNDSCVNHGGLRDPAAGGSGDITGSTGGNSVPDNSGNDPSNSGSN